MARRAHQCCASQHCWRCGSLSAGSAAAGCFRRIAMEAVGRVLQHPAPQGTTAPCPSGYYSTPPLRVLQHPAPQGTTAPCPSGAVGCPTAPQCAVALELAGCSGYSQAEGRPCRLCSKRTPCTRRWPRARTLAHGPLPSTPSYTCIGTGLTPATPAPGLGSPLPHLHRDWAHPSHICAGTGLPPATSAPGLGSPLPHLRRDWALPCHICTGTGSARVRRLCC